MGTAGRLQELARQRREQGGSQCRAALEVARVATLFVEEEGAQPSTVPVWQSCHGALCMGQGSRAVRLLT